MSQKVERNNRLISGTQNGSGWKKNKIKVAVKALHSVLTNDTADSAAQNSSQCINFANLIRYSCFSSISLRIRTVRSDGTAKPAECTPLLYQALKSVPLFSSIFHWISGEKYYFLPKYSILTIDAVSAVHATTLTHIETQMNQKRFFLQWFYWHKLLFPLRDPRFGSQSYACIHFYTNEDRRHL